MCHNKLCDGVKDLSNKAFISTCMRDDSLIYADCGVKSPKYQLEGSKPSQPTKKSDATEQKGDLLIRDFWYNGIKSFHDMRVINNDTKYYLKKTPEKCLYDALKANKNMYLEAFPKQRRHFSPFVASLWRRSLP